MYLLTRVFVLVSHHWILPPSFTFHLSLHWSCIWVPSIHSDTAFQNLGVLAGVLPSSIACITWSKQTTSSAVHGPAWSSAICDSHLMVGGIPEQHISWGTRCLWNWLQHTDPEHSRASLISTQVNCWLTSLDDCIYEFRRNCRTSSILLFFACLVWAGAFITFLLTTVARVLLCVSVSSLGLRPVNPEYKLIQKKKKSRWLSVGPVIPIFHSYWQLQSWVFLHGPGFFVSKGLIQNLGTVSYQPDMPSWNPAHNDRLGFRQSNWDIINVMHQGFPRDPPDDPCLEQDLPDLPHWYQLPIGCHKEYLRWLCTHLPFDIDGVHHAHILFPWEYIHLLDTVFLLCDSVTRCMLKCNL